MRMLIAEDDPALASFVKKGLEAEHYAVDVSSDGERIRAQASEFNYDLLVLDLNLPRLDGVSILRHLRTRKPSMPILILTGRSRVEDRVQCLDLGADDLVKPFSFTELSARIRALLRRSHLPAESVLQVEDLKLDRVERQVERAGKRIELTSKEFALLEYLMRNAGRRVTRAMIIEHVWNLIEGHTDDVPIHNTQFASNWELSTARSTELVRLLIVKYGFFPDRLSAAGYAQYHPIADNAAPGGRAQNRRSGCGDFAQRESGPREFSGLLNAFARGPEMRQLVSEVASFL